VAGRHGLGWRWDRGDSDHLSSTGRSSGNEDKGMNADLEAVEEGGAPGCFYSAEAASGGGGEAKR
jgi:hypothetical protein